MKISILHFDSWEVQKEDGEWKREKLSKKKEKEKGKHFSELKDKNAQIAKPSSVQPPSRKKKNIHTKAHYETLELHGGKYPKIF